MLRMLVLVTLVTVALLLLADPLTRLLR